MGARASLQVPAPDSWTHTRRGAAEAVAGRPRFCEPRRLRHFALHQQGAGPADLSTSPVPAPGCIFCVGQGLFMVSILAQRPRLCDHSVVSFESGNLDPLPLFFLFKSGRMMWSPLRLHAKLGRDFISAKAPGFPQGWHRICRPRAALAPHPQSRIRALFQC